jgi:hypothetical protein
MVARVHDPIDGWGGGPEPLPPCEVEHCTRPSPPHTLLPTCYASAKILTIQSNITLHNHIGQKARVRAQPSQGVEGWRRIPPPTPSEIMPRYDTYNRLREPAALQ